MKKFYYLSTCDTCKRIMKELDLSSFEIIDIKTQNISKGDLELARKTVNSYLDLFNKRARKIKELNIDLSSKSEKELEQLILGEYSFLKRPLMISDSNIIAGNSKEAIAQMKTLNGNS
ncbi:MAG: ArsC/Spx/MgsR family protein [Crocinitomicaceae bacterium]